MIRASAPGKLILFGEHAVVHGQPAIAVPLHAISATIEVEAAPAGTGITIALPDVQAMLSAGNNEAQADNALTYTAQLVLQKLAVNPPDLRLMLHSTIPMGAGFGSGAAVSTALARALSSALGQPLDNPTLNELVYEVEKIHHGTPSGIDNTVIVYEQPVFFIRGQAITTFRITKPFHLLVGRVDYATPTHVTVGDVRKLHEQQPQSVGQIFATIGEIARQARRAIETGEIATLGPLMNENQALLRELTVSDTLLDNLCEVAMQAGAWGAKLSGGGRGGNFIVLVPEMTALWQPIQHALLQAGAVEVFFTTIGETH